MLKKITMFCLFTVLLAGFAMAQDAPVTKVAKAPSKNVKARFNDMVKKGFKKVYVTDSKLDVDVVLVKDDSESVGDAGGFFDRYKDCVCFIPLESDKMAQMVCTCFPPEKDEDGESTGKKPSGEDDETRDFWNR